MTKKVKSSFDLTDDIVEKLHEEAQENDRSDAAQLRQILNERYGLKTHD